MSFTSLFKNNNQKLFLAAVFIIGFNAAAYAQTKKTEVADPAFFQKIAIQTNVPMCNDSLRKCGEVALVALDLAGFGGPENIRFNTETFVFGNNVAIYLLSITGYEDDSVIGERLRVAFLKSGKGYKFVQAGRQFQCTRGKNAGKWTKELCP